MVSFSSRQPPVMPRSASAAALGARSLRSDPHRSPDSQHDVTKRYATPFLLKYLAHKKKFARRLRSSDDGTAALIARPR